MELHSWHWDQLVSGVHFHGLDFHTTVFFFPEPNVCVCQVANMSHIE